MDSKRILIGRKLRTWEKGIVYFSMALLTMPAFFFVYLGITENIIGLVIASPLWLGFAVLIHYLITKDATTLFLTPDSVEIERKKFFGKELITIPKNDITNIEVNKEYRGRGTYIRIIRFSTIYAKYFTAYLRMEDDISPLLNAFETKSQNNDNQLIISKSENIPQPTVTISREDLRVRDLVMEEKKRINTTKSGVIFTCIILLIAAFFTTGLNWFKGKNEKITDYRGSIGHQSFRIYFKKDTTKMTELPHHYLQYIRYGMTTYHLDNLDIQPISSEINLQDVEYIFADNTNLLDNTYLGYFSLRGNYWTYPFSSKVDLQLDSIQVVPQNQTIPILIEKSNWKTQVWLYIFMNFVQLISFASFFVVIGHSSPIFVHKNIIEFRKKESILRITTILSFAFALASIYKTFVDAPYNSEIFWIWECILYVIVMVLFYKVISRWHNSRDYIRFTDSRLEFKDNEREMSIPYIDIINFKMENVHNEKGALTENATLILQVKDKTIKIETDALNVGECDLEIADLIYKKTNLPRKEVFWEKILN
jgi:hypothetical protein